MMNLSDETPPPPPARPRRELRTWLAPAGLVTLGATLCLPWILALQLRDLRRELARVDGFARTALELHNDSLLLHSEAIKELLRRTAPRTPALAPQPQPQPRATD